MSDTEIMVIRWFPLFQALLQGICLQASETPFSASGFL